MAKKPGKAFFIVRNKTQCISDKSEVKKPELIWHKKKRKAVGGRNKNL